MSFASWIAVNDEVQAALDGARPIVALESTLIAHGLPWPVNFETALEAEVAVRTAGAIPATIAVLKGQPTIGLSRTEIEGLARANDVSKASRRDLAPAIAQARTAATTVAATMFLAHQAGIRVLATGGIGGAHRGCSQTFDISADLFELARTPVLVACAGAKCILDLPRTLEILDTLSVPVVGFRTHRFPAFYSSDSGLPVSVRVDGPAEAAMIFAAHLRTGGAGVVVAQPVEAKYALGADEITAALGSAEQDATRQSICGAALTPFLLKRLAELTNGRTLAANRALIRANAELAGAVASALPK